MKTTFLAAVVFALCALGGHRTARAEDDCLELGWLDGRGGWTYHRAWITSMDGNELHIKYAFHEGKMHLKVTEKEADDGDDVYVFKGEWREEHGREGGKVRMVLKKGHKHAKGFYTFGGWEAKHYEIKLGDCTHVR